MLRSDAELCWDRLILRAPVAAGQHTARVLPRSLSGADQSGPQQSADQSSRAMVVCCHLCILINNNFKAFLCHCTNLHYAVKCLLQSLCSFIIKITKQTRYQTFQVSSQCVCSLSPSSNCWKCEAITKPPLMATVGQPLEHIPIVMVPIWGKSNSCWWMSSFVLPSSHTFTFHEEHRGK